jgi:lipopolysaccharide biosynthesis regulator YciM
MEGEKPWANADPSQADAQILAEKLADDEAVFKTLTPMLEQLAPYCSRYVCQHCGFQANRHYWQCPGCQQWDRYPPQRTDEMPAA